MTEKLIRELVTKLKSLYHDYKTNGEDSTLDTIINTERQLYNLVKLNSNLFSSMMDAFFEI